MADQRFVGINEDTLIQKTKTMVRDVTKLAAMARKIDGPNSRREAVLTEAGKLLESITRG